VAFGRRVLTVCSEIESPLTICWFLSLRAARSAISRSQQVRIYPPLNHLLINNDSGITNNDVEI
jgi:hypothetical protein